MLYSTRQLKPNCTLVKISQAFACSQTKVDVSQTSKFQHFMHANPRRTCVGALVRMCVCALVAHQKSCTRTAAAFLGLVRLSGWEFQTIHFPGRLCKQVRISPVSRTNSLLCWRRCPEDLTLCYWHRYKATCINIHCSCSSASRLGKGSWTDEGEKKEILLSSGTRSFEPPTTHANSEIRWIPYAEPRHRVAKVGLQKLTKVLTLVRERIHTEALTWIRWLAWEQKFARNTALWSYLGDL